jgi:hypothetical protein
LRTRQHGGDRPCRRQGAEAEHATTGARDATEPSMRQEERGWRISVALWKAHPWGVSRQGAHLTSSSTAVGGDATRAARARAGARAALGLGVEDGLTALPSAKGMRPVSIS